MVKNLEGMVAKSDTYLSVDYIKGVSLQLFPCFFCIRLKTANCCRIYKLYFRSICKMSRVKLVIITLCL